MLDPLTALSLAGSIVQFVDFGNEVLYLTQKIYRSQTGSVEYIDDLNSSIQSFRMLSGKLQSLSTTPASSQYQDHAEGQALATKCIKFAERFSVALQELQTTGPGKWESMKLAVKIKKQESTLQKHHKELEQLRIEVMGYILAIIGDRQCSVANRLDDMMKRDSLAQTTIADDLSKIKQQLEQSVRVNPVVTTSGVNDLIFDDDGKYNSHGFGKLKKQYDNWFDDERKEELRQREVQRAQHQVLQERGARKAAEQTRKNAAAQSQAVQSGIADLLQEARRVAAAQAVLHSLRFEEMNDRYLAIKERHEHTFEWLFEQPETLLRVKGLQCEFSHWLMTHGGIFWVTGKAGSGKSTLVKFLCDHERTQSLLRVWSGDAKLIVAHHFFWNAGTVLQKSQVGLLRSICFDVLRRCPSLIPTLTKRRYEAQLNADLSHDALEVKGSSRVGDSWSLAELRALVRAIASVEHIGEDRSLQSVRFAFFIDGLDEFDGDHHEIIDAVQEMAKSRFVKICVASRPWNVFQHAFGGNPKTSLKLQDLTRDDIVLYVRSKLERNDHFKQIMQRNPQSLHIVEEVTGKANGVFLWVVLVVNELIRGLDNSDGLADLRRRLRKLPPGLEDYFKHMFDTIDDFYQQQTARIFLVCLHARHRMALVAYAAVEQDILEEAASQGTNSSDIFLSRFVDEVENTLYKRLNARCRDLIEICYDGAAWHWVDFLHRTVYDFMSTKDMSDLLALRAGRDFDVHAVLCAASAFTIENCGLARPTSRYNPYVYAIDLLHYASMAEGKVVLRSLQKFSSEPGSSPIHTLHRLLPSGASEGLIECLSAEEATLALMVHQGHSSDVEEYIYTLADSNLGTQPMFSGLRGAGYLAIALEVGDVWLRIQTWEESVDNSQLICTLNSEMVSLLLENGADPNLRPGRTHSADRPKNLLWSDSLSSPWELFLIELQRFEVPQAGLPKELLATVETMLVAGAKSNRRFLEPWAAKQLGFDDDGDLPPKVLDPSGGQTKPKVTEVEILERVFGVNETRSLLKLQKNRSAIGGLTGLGSWKFRWWK